MIEAPIQHIQYMYCDKIMADIWFSYARNYIKVQTYSEDFLHSPFGRKEDNMMTLTDLDVMLEGRCFERVRGDCEQILKEMGIPCYDPLAIVHQTHGYLANSYEWIRFDDDPSELSLAALQKKYN